MCCLSFFFLIAGYCKIKAEQREAKIEFGGSNFAYHTGNFGLLIFIELLLTLVFFCMCVVQGQINHCAVASDNDKVCKQV